MTGLYNHNAFVTELDKQIAAFTEVSPLSLVMVDVDNFKSINDTYGHDCGDVVLTFLASIIKKHCDTATAARSLPFSSAAKAPPRRKQLRSRFWRNSEITPSPLRKRPSPSLPV